MKQYTFEGKNGNKDISFTIEDLIPVQQTMRYTFKQLTALINHRDYKPCPAKFNEEYKKLYSKPENRGSDFFRIKGTDLIVIPRNFCFPTILREKDLKFPPLTADNALQALTIININDLDEGIQKFRYQSIAIVDSNKYEHTYGPSYDQTILKNKDFKNWAVVSFKTEKQLDAFQIFLASKNTISLEQHLKNFEIEDEAESFEGVKAVHHFKLAGEIYEIFEIKEGERWEYYDTFKTSRRYSFGIEQDDNIEHDNIEQVAWWIFEIANKIYDIPE